MTYYDKASGLLFVGDPHLSSVKPGRRVEGDREYLLLTVDKLDQCVEYANTNNLAVVILGDLFDKSKDSHPLLINMLFKTLRKAIHPVYCMPGNHDLLATDITDDTALAAVEATGLLVVLHANGAINARFQFGDRKVALGAVWHGSDIPKDVQTWKNDPNEDVVLITHHDIAFEGAYPGSLDPHPISGCRLLVNGHMHRYKPEIRCEDTVWFNPGNILRQTISDANHEPAAWWWNPEHELPQKHALRYVKNVFDWTGKNKQLQSGSLTPYIQIGEEPEEAAQSEFVSKLKIQAMTGMELPKSKVGDIILEDLNEVIKDPQLQYDKDPDAVKILRLLYTELIAQNSAFKTVTDQDTVSSIQQITPPDKNL